MPLVPQGYAGERRSFFGVLVCLLKDFLREFGQCVPPHLPLVHAWGRIPHVADVVLLQIVGEIELSGLTGILRAAAQKQKLQFPIDVVGVIEETGQVLLQAELLVADQSRAELSHPRE